MPQPFTQEAAAALVFLILYLCLFTFMVTRYIKKDFILKSRWTFLLSHTIVRVVSQALGIAFAMLGFENIGVFAAYLVLSAEGYFTLTLASYFFLKNYHEINFGQSWLAHERSSNSRERLRHRLATIFLLPILLPWIFHPRVMDVVDGLLIPANAIIVTGGSYLAGVTGSTNDTPHQIANAMHLSKILRTTGQCVFLGITFLFALCLLKTIRDARRARRGVHATLILLCIVAFFLHVRGIFGVLQAAIFNLSYISHSNYNDSGFTPRFTALEYCLSILPEFMAAALLNLTWFTSRSGNNVVEEEANGDVGLSKERSMESAR